MAAPPQPGAAPAPEAREARDVMAFGHEAGRVLSDGRIVGRAEPFAKVFPSSREVKRAVGALAWVILEDIALEARIDDAGRLVSETSVRRIAANLGLNKDTVTKHLRTLREHGFVFQEEYRQVASGRWEPCRYVLDPSACVERFTHTPTPSEPQTRRSEPCPQSSDTVGRPVSEDTGHGDVGQGKEHEELQEQQHAARAGAPAGGVGEDAAAAAAAEADSGEVRQQLLALGVAGHVADDLLARHPVGRVAQVLEASAAQQTRNAAGWVVTALAGEWDVTDRLARVRAERARREHAETRAAEHHGCRAEEAAERERGEGWAAAVSAALDDAQLAEAVALAATTVPGLNRASLPLTRAQLLAWAAAAAALFPDRPFDEALSDALAARLHLRADAAVVALPRPPPPNVAAAADLSERLAAVLDLPRPSARNRKGAA